ncbi:MAG: GNAT family N-acetyltransferase [Pseudomonadota bacterium]|nr:GNAT family N-acetyltransferase [Pseudomonadota bacterium]
MLAQLEASARTLGIAELSLDASLNAVSFYERAGYSAAAESDHELAPGVSIPCIAMRKDLNG